jgi:hypothetical protein
MNSGLTTTFNHLALFGKEGGAERGVSAAFLDEASIILENDLISSVADQFRNSAAAWDKLGEALLPDKTPQLKETRDLMVERHNLFLNQGNKA